MQTYRMSWFDYFFNHVVYRGLQSVRSSFNIWSDLMCGNYKDYALLPDDDPCDECAFAFWSSLGEDTVYSKEVLEDLLTLFHSYVGQAEDCTPFNSWN